MKNVKCDTLYSTFIFNLIVNKNENIRRLLLKQETHAQLLVLYFIFVEIKTQNIHDIVFFFLQANL